MDGQASGGGAAVKGRGRRSSAAAAAARPRASGGKRSKAYYVRQVRRIQERMAREADAELKRSAQRRVSTRRGASSSPSTSSKRRKPAQRGRRGKPADEEEGDGEVDGEAERDGDDRMEEEEEEERKVPAPRSSVRRSRAAPLGARKRQRSASVVRNGADPAPPDSLSASPLSPPPPSSKRRKEMKVLNALPTPIVHRNEDPAEKSSNSPVTDSPLVSLPPTPSAYVDPKLMLDSPPPRPHRRAPSPPSALRSPSPTAVAADSASARTSLSPGNVFQLSQAVLHSALTAPLHCTALHHSLVTTNRMPELTSCDRMCSPAAFSLRSVFVSFR